MDATTTKLGPIVDEKAVIVTVELSAAVHQDLVAYAEVLGCETGQAVADSASSSCR